MTLSATVAVDVNATKSATSGLTSVIDQHQLSFAVNVTDCTEAWSDRRTIGGLGYEDIDISQVGVSNIKMLCVRNMAATDIAMSAGWSGNEFRIFPNEGTAWTFSPIINLGSAVLRGVPIRPGGVYLLSCPNSVGFPSASGGNILRVGGVSGSQFEVCILGN